MNTNNFGLNAELLSDMNKILTQFPEITAAAIFGSRAMGKFKPYSDIDITLYGDINDINIAQHVTLLFDELPAPYKFDVLVYNEIKNPALRNHIDGVGIFVFVKEANIFKEAKILP